ncbi:hypothetical protein E1B28_007549 [Marasmius oreades]|uniref:Uncharacterized protein n=1 Tax=Marasmius oreades TaxID=181124 RepID=A0A9P7S3K8_9AGAR|nr:uncharacterized protein E1B28_007549 [Marasmius oreades]KAG7093913.1 hypothetical protein E1B28_007549 [Marasmius oreades]
MQNDMPTISKNRNFKLRALLQGHTGSVACLAAHPLGTLLASGGEKGTQIWDLRNGEQLNSPTNGAERGATLAITFITRTDDTDDGLAFGTDDGWLSIWRRRGNNDFAEVYCNRLEGGKDGQEISAMAYDIKSCQLVVAHRSEKIHRFVIDAEMQPTKICSVRIANHYPQAVAFGQTAARGPEIWSFGRDDGKIHVLDEEGKIVKTKTTGVVIGHAAIHVRDDTFIVNDVSQGVGLYKLSSTDRIKTFEVSTDKLLPRNVCFHEDGSTIVIGSDNGRVYVFDRRTGEVGDIIDIGVHEWTQSLATVEVEGVPLIIVGDSGDHAGNTPLQIWEKVKVKVPASDEGGGRKVGGGFNWLQFICILLSILFVLENVLVSAM